MYILMPLFHLKYGYLITPQHHQQRVEGKSLVRRRFSREKMEKFFFFLLFHLLFSHKAHISKSYDYVQQRQLHCVWAMRWGEEKLACAHETKISTSLLIKDVLCSADIELIWSKRKKKTHLLSVAQSFVFFESSERYFWNMIFQKKSILASFYIWVNI